MDPDDDVIPATPQEETVFELQQMRGDLQEMLSQLQ